MLSGLFPRRVLWFLLLSVVLLPTLSPALAAPLIEAESALTTGRIHGGDGTLDRKLTAFGGACMGSGWGRVRGDWMEYTVEGTNGPAVLYLRYARHSISGRTRWSPRFELKVQVGATQRTVELPFTGDWELWRWVEVPLGTVAAGPQTLRLESLTDDAPINLDALVLSPAGQAGQVPPEVARPLLFDGSKHIRIQLSPSVQPLEMDKLFAIGEASYSFLKEYLGEEPTSRITVNIIAPAEQGDQHVGHSSGYSMYLAEGRIMDTSHNWVHEMTHCFQRESGPWPTWLSEGEAWLTSYEAETAVFGSPMGAERISPATFTASLPQYQEALLVNGHNLMQFWGTPELPSSKLGAAYGFTNYIVGQLRQRGGPELMPRYRVLLREDAKSHPQTTELTPAQSDAIVVDRLSRAAGEDLRPLFTQWGFQLATR